MNSQQRRRLKRQRANWPTFTMVENRSQPVREFLNGWIDFMKADIPYPHPIMGSVTQMSFSLDLDATNFTYTGFFNPPPLYSVEDFRRDCKAKNRPWLFTGKIIQQPIQQ